MIPFRVSESEFQDLVRAALEDIPDRFRDALYSEVAIIVEPVPPLDLLQSETPPLDPELLGLYVGTPLTERSLDDIVKLTIYMTDLGHFAQVNETMAEYFTEPYPARATVEVAGLPLGAEIEVEAVLGL